MKKFIVIKKVELSDTLVLDFQASYFTGEPFDIYCKNNINPSAHYKTISIVNVRSLSADLLSLLTPHYLGGTEIIVNGLHFVNRYAKPRYSYHWTEFNRQSIPSSLAKFPVGKSTFLTELAKVRTNYLPNNLWIALDDYSQDRIKKCIAYNHFDFALAENWYKELMHTIPCLTKLMPSSKNPNAPKAFRVFSPNAKTFYEFTAEQCFKKSLEQLQPGLRPLNAEELAFLKQYAPAYGIEIPQFAWRINSRKTKHGYTYEPERVLVVKQSDIEKTYYDKRNTNNLPKFVRDGYKVKYDDNDKLLRDSYTQLIWMMKHCDDSILATGYHRCPICHCIYHEKDGCLDHIEPIEYINADNMFYGISSTYEDYSATSKYYKKN